MSTVNVTSRFVTVCPMEPNSVSVWSEIEPGVIRRDRIRFDGAYHAYRSGHLVLPSDTFLKNVLAETWTTHQLLDSVITRHRSLTDAQAWVTGSCAHKVIDWLP